MVQICSPDSALTFETCLRSLDYVAVGQGSSSLSEPAVLTSKTLLALRMKYYPPLPSIFIATTLIGAACVVPRISLLPDQSQTLLVHLEKAKTRRCRKSFTTKQLVADPRRSEQRGKSTRPSVFSPMRTIFASYISPSEILFSSTVSVWLNHTLIGKY